MAELKRIVGDATEPIGNGNKLIVHCCNDQGGWGSGFVMALSKKWKQPEQAYRVWSGDPRTFKLGELQVVKVDTEISVGNLIGQHKMGIINGVPPIRYEAIREGLIAARNYCLEHNASFHSPQFGAGLAGGKWDTIEAIIQEELVDKGVDCTIYLFEDKNSPFYIPVGFQRH